MSTSLTVREVAARVGRTEETVRRWIWSGRLTASKRGNVLYVDESDLSAVEAARQSDGTPPQDRLTLATWAQRVEAWRQTTPKGAGKAADLVIEDRASRADG